MQENSKSQENTALNVDTVELTKLGIYLENTAFDRDFDAMKNKMSTITDSCWVDEVGICYSDAFSSFMDDAKKINEELIRSGEFAKEMSSKYEEIVQAYLKKLEEV